MFASVFIVFDVENKILHPWAMYEFKQNSSSMSYEFLWLCKKRERCLPDANYRERQSVRHVFIAPLLFPKAICLHLANLCLSFYGSGLIVRKITIPESTRAYRLPAQEFCFSTLCSRNFETDSIIFSCRRKEFRSVRVEWRPSCNDKVCHFLQGRVNYSH